MIKFILPFILPVIVIVAGLTHAQDMSPQENENVFQRQVTKTLICAKHEYLTNDLTKTHNEERKWFGVAGDNLAELFVNKENGSWTLILTGRDKVACGLVGGDYGSQFIEEETDL